jgi:hypothetical protein
VLTGAPPGDHERRGGCRVDRLAALVQRPSDARDPLRLRARGDELDDLAFEVERVARAHARRPTIAPSPSLSQRRGTVMVLWASALSLAASSAGLVMLGSNPILGELSALGLRLRL